MPWRPSVPGEVPTLGYAVIDWLSEYLNSPRGDGAPLRLTLEQEDFVLRWYALNPDTGRFVYPRGLLGRSRGWGKSPLLGALSMAEGLADVLFDGWDAGGQPVGRPWSTQLPPLIHVAAVSEFQTKNTWDAILAMCEEAPVVDAYPGFEAMQTVINLPVGQVQRITSSSRTLKGARTVFGVLDQTEEWVPSNGGPLLAQTIRTNCAKVGGRTVESPNAFIPGDGSVAEESANAYLLGVEGKLRDSSVVLYDHREAPASTDLTDMDSLVAGLRYAYGCSSDHPDGCVLHSPPCEPGWAPIESNARMFWDPANDVQQLRSDFLNQITHASDAWVSKPEWLACQNLDKVVGDQEPVVLGFDGSRGRSRGNADATALVGCRVSDGHVFTVRVWEPPPGRLAGREWAAPVVEVDAQVRDAFARWNVVGFYADPSGWEVQVAEWEAAYGRKLRVKASQRDPIAAWPRGKNTAAIQAVEATRLAIVNGELTHDGSPDLMRHVLNARRRQTRGGYLLYKQFPESPDKIDAAYAAVMAWSARTAAVATGVGARVAVRRSAIFA